MNNDGREKMGQACKNCGHPAGTHEALSGEDLDEPENGTGCRNENCSCPEFID